MVWSDPEVETVAPGIHRVPVPLPNDGLRAVNVYMIEDGDGVTLVDSGWNGPEARAAIDRGLAVAGAELGDVHRMLITHMHYDHLGQADELRRAGAGEYWLGEEEKESFSILVTDPVESRRERLDQLEAHGAVELAEKGRASDGAVKEPLTWQPPGRWVADGEQAPLSDGQLTAILTPGHTRGHLCFLHGDRKILFSGDHVLPHITPSIGFEPHTNPLALVDFLESQARVAALDVELVLPAHGEVFTDLVGRVDELTAHHDVRLDACRAALSEEGSSAFTAASRIGWTRRETPFEELNAFNQTLAVWETAAHLELLAVRGTVTRRVVDGTITFTRV